MSHLLERYETVSGAYAVRELQQLADPLRGISVVHVNSTRRGGGVAEILTQLVPLQRELGLDSQWEVLEGNQEFFSCTKKFHNGLQGFEVFPTKEEIAAYEDVSATNAGRLRDKLERADAVFIHDPQPALLLSHFPARTGRWIWRCHIDISHPHRPVWRYLRKAVSGYDASILSLAEFARTLPHPQYLIAPAIDPFSEKNRDLPTDYLDATAQAYGIDRNRPIMLQVSRFDRFKDPLGVLEAYRLVKRFIPALQVVLAGGGADDDPEGSALLAAVREASAGDRDAHILQLPNDAHKEVNALQRLADVVLQKSLREGFGLTVSEAMWKAKPVIGGDTGGIRLQIADRYTGFLVHSPEGAALRTRFLLRNPEFARQLGERARRHVRENFLMTRLLREHLTLLVSLFHKSGERVDVTQWKS